MRKASISRRVFIGLLGVAFAALTSWSWRRWADLRVDFGEELYVPWRLSEGAALYRDVAHLYGPLSKHLDALVFSLFGASVTNLVLFNLLVLALFTALLYRLLTQVADEATAFGASLFFLCVFAFGQYVTVGNYNFVCPYRHEAIHGTMLALAAIAAVFWHARDPRPWRLGLAGLCAGGVLCTKPEVSLAAGASLAVGFTLLALIRREALSLRALAAFGAGLVAPAALFTLYFLARGFSVTGALSGALGAWAPLWRAPQTATGTFFLFGMGLDKPGPRLAEMALALAALSGATLLLAALDYGLGRLTPRRRVVVGSVLALPGVWLGTTDAIGWELAPRALPVVCAATAAMCIGLAVRRRAETEVALGHFQLAVFATFALAMLPKMILYTRVKHFGFYLALPASLLLVVLLLRVVPRLLEVRSGAKGRVFLAGAALLIAAFTFSHLRLSNDIYSRKTLRVGGGDDWFYGFEPAVIDADEVVARVLGVLRDEVPQGATVVALPEGVLFNYLSRHPSSIRFTLFSTTELSAFGETTMLQSLESSPPDYVLWVRRDMGELGVGRFGEDPAFGRQIGDWVRAHYTAVRSFDTRPRTHTRYGVDILKRR